MLFVDVQTLTICQSLCLWLVVSQKMGCQSSKPAKNPVVRPPPIQVQLVDDGQPKVSETVEKQMFQAEQEQHQIQAILAAEKALRAISAVMIEKSSSCESLIDHLDPKQLNEIKEIDNSYKMQNQVRMQLRKKSGIDRLMQWVVSDPKFVAWLIN